jgi:hypothetical protein
VWLYDAALISGLVAFTFKTPEETYSFLIPGYYYFPLLYSHVFLTFALLPLLYYKIFTVAKRHEFEIYQQSGKRQRKYYCLQMKATRTVGLVILLFVVVWLPFLVRQLFNVSDISNGEWDIVNMGLETLTYCNGAVNFFVYSYRDVRIRRAMFKILDVRQCKTSVTPTHWNWNMKIALISIRECFGANRVYL